MTSSQTDLLSDLPRPDTPGRTEFQVTPEFVARIRGELNETLALVRDAELLPWPDLARTTLAELRFNSIARWLPEADAAMLRDVFGAEMTRLYDAEDHCAEAG